MACLDSCRVFIIDYALANTVEGAQNGDLQADNTT